MSSLTLDSKIARLVKRDRQYGAEAYHFVFEALDYVSDRPSPIRASRHISVVQLLEGIRQLALEQFGPLARCVFESWGVYRTEDFGRIVFRLIECDLLNRSDSDHMEDFVDGYSFREVFEEGYRPRIRLGEDA